MSDGTPSRLEQLRAAFGQELKEPRFYKVLPHGKPFSNDIVAEYRLFSTDEAKNILEGKDELARNSDALVNSLVAIHVADKSDENADERGLVELGTWLGQDLGGPVRFDKRLADTVGIEDGTARQIALAMFGGNEMALGAQAAQLLAWMTDTRSEVLQDFVAGS